MSELVIKQHDFENAKKELKRFSEQTKTTIGLKTVANSKSVGEFLKDYVLSRGIGLSHKVTGKELNELTTQIQTYLIGINDAQNKLIKEFGQVYNALEALDKDYIQAILVSIKATEETSQALKKDQDNIKKLNEYQRKTLENLIEFKQKFDGCAHLEDIDKIWKSLHDVHKEFESLQNSFGEYFEDQKSTSEIENEINNLSNQLPPDFKHTFLKLFGKYVVKTNKSISELKSKFNRIRPASKFPVIAGIIALILGVTAFISVFLPLKVHIDNENKRLTQLVNNNNELLRDEFSQKIDYLTSDSNNNETRISSFVDELNGLKDNYQKLVEDNKRIMTDSETKIAGFAKIVEEQNTEINGLKAKLALFEKSDKNYSSEMKQQDGSNGANAELNEIPLREKDSNEQLDGSNEADNGQSLETQSIANNDDNSQPYDEETDETFNSDNSQSIGKTHQNIAFKILKIIGTVVLGILTLGIILIVIRNII